MPELFRACFCLLALCHRGALLVTLFLRFLLLLALLRTRCLCRSSELLAIAIDFLALPCLLHSLRFLRTRLLLLALCHLNLERLTLRELCATFLQVLILRLRVQLAAS